MTRPPLSNEQHARVEDAKRHLNAGLAALSEDCPMAEKTGFAEFSMRAALIAVNQIECPIRLDVERTADVPAQSPPPILRPVPSVGGSLNIGNGGGEAA